MREMTKNRDDAVKTASDGFILGWDEGQKDIIGWLKDYCNNNSEIILSSVDSKQTTNPRTKKILDVENLLLMIRNNELEEIKRGN